MEEWKVARDVLAKFDQCIHDLSHWGVGFITALLTAESLLLPRPVFTTALLNPPVKAPAFKWSTGDETGPTR